MSTRPNTYLGLMDRNNQTERTDVTSLAFMAGALIGIVVLIILAMPH